MQNWEYKTILRSRGMTQTTKINANWMTATKWDIDIDQMLEELGNQGWELVTVSPRSSYLGGHNRFSIFFSTSLYNDDYAGFTSEEIWVFKRPKQ